MDPTQKPYRKSSARFPEGVPYNYRDMSLISPISESQLQSVIDNTTIINTVAGAVPDASTSVKGIVLLASNGGTGALTVVQGNDTRLLPEAQYSAIQFIMDGAGSPLTAGMTIDIYCPFNFTILRNVVLADQSAAAQFDVRSKAYSGFPPAGGQSIVASAPPALSAAIKSKDSTLTGWTTAVPADNTLQAYLTSVDGVITRLTLTLYIQKT